MKCLSVRQPWAWAIVTGKKRVENRARLTTYRGPLLIHAGKSRLALTDHLPDGTPVPADLAFGCIIGLVQVVDSVHVDELRRSDPFAIGPWCWVLEDPQPITPVPWPGQLSFFDVPLDRLDEVVLRRRV